MIYSTIENPNSVESATKLVHKKTRRLENGFSRFTFPDNEICFQFPVPGGGEAR
jgi:hypothetical protein